MKKLLLSVLLTALSFLVVTSPTYANTYYANTSYRTSSPTTYRRHMSYRMAQDYSNHTNVAFVPSVESWQVENGQAMGMLNGNGQVLVNWGTRGGTCNIRYSEVNEPFYKYRTSAGCDEANHWISQLQPGQQYKFEIAQDNWSNWSGKAVAQAF